VCDALGISYPMVNYYFGNRDGLIAEAGHVTYVRYVEKLWAAVEEAPRTPVDRLRAWFEAHLRLNVEIRGWGAVLNYPASRRRSRRSSTSASATSTAATSRSTWRA
jgi:AcrR family transcriptional regulator